MDRTQEQAERDAAEKALKDSANSQRTIPQPKPPVSR